MEEATIAVATVLGSVLLGYLFRQKPPVYDHCRKPKKQFPVTAQVFRKHTHYCDKVSRRVQKKTWQNINRHSGLIPRECPSKNIED